MIPKTVRKRRIRENFSVFDFTLSDNEMEQLYGLDKGPSGRYFVPKVLKVCWNDEQDTILMKKNGKWVVRDADHKFFPFNDDDSSNQEPPSSSQPGDQPPGGSSSDETGFFFQKTVAVRD